MADYIERDELLADLRLARSLTPGLPYEGPMAKIVDTFFDMIATYPAADVAPVKRSRWWPKNLDACCSVCGGGMPRCPDGSQDESDFCPNCGAKMS